MRKYYIIILVALLILGVPTSMYLWKGDKSKSSQIPEAISEVTYVKSGADMITVELPFPGAVVGKNFSVIGKVRGTWFFEASFPVKIVGKNGEILAHQPAQAQGEWMTENFVPFRADIKIPETYIGPATLILEKDNPSGMPEHDASMSFDFIIEY